MPGTILISKHFDVEFKSILDAFKGVWLFMVYSEDFLPKNSLGIGVKFLLLSLIKGTP
jgi:hypothetical protein